MPHLSRTSRFCVAIGLALFFCSHPAEAKRLHEEKVYQEKWCHKAGGKIEVVQEDKTRVDCLTSDYAIEFDFGSKWAESIGQALHYSIQTGKTPGIVLILEQKKDIAYWIRLNTIIEQFRLNIKTWQMIPDDL